MSQALTEALTERPAESLAHLELLAELGQEFAQSIDIGATLNHAVDRIAGYMHAEAASVFLIEEPGGWLECRACAGPVNVTGLRLEVGRGIVGRAAKENMCQLVRDAGADPDFARNVDRDTGFRTRSILCTPLRSADGVIGVLQVLNKRDGGLFDENDRDTLRVLAAPTALAINNARMASGDFYDHFELPDGRIGFAIGDVSGKGMNAALLMVRATSLLRWIGKSGMPPGEWLSQVNNELLTSVADGMFICAVAGYYDPDEGSLVWSNAGFPPPLHDTGRRFSAYPAPAPPLAIIPHDAYPEERVRLRGGAMYFYSDGVTEARAPDRSMLMEAGLRKVIAAHRDRPPKPRLGSIVSHLRRMQLGDDTTLLLVEGRS